MLLPSRVIKELVLSATEMLVAVLEEIVTKLSKGIRNHVILRESTTQCSPLSEVRLTAL